MEVIFNIKIKPENNAKLILKIILEKIKTKIIFKLRGRPKGLKNKVYTPNPKFNRET